MQALKSSNHSVMNVSTVKQMVDIRQWISPHLEDIRYHTDQHIFLFKKNVSNKAAMYYKAWSHHEWEPSNEGILLLKVCTYIPLITMLCFVLSVTYNFLSLSYKGLEPFHRKDSILTGNLDHTISP